MKRGVKSLLLICSAYVGTVVGALESDFVDSGVGLVEGFVERRALRCHAEDSAAIGEEAAAGKFRAFGAGVIDRLREMGVPHVFEINFGQQANDPNRFANIRAEIYFKMLEWLKAGGCIPNEPRLKSELTVTEYKFTSAGKIILQPKEEIKELTGHSPDGADSAVLTFAVQIHKATTGRRRVLTANTEYSFA